jgi:nitrous oxide reductase accessory protein NosL
MILICLVIFGATYTAAGEISAKPPSPKDKCPVCGMFVSKYPDWVTSVTFKDGTSLYFDGAKDFFTYYNNMNKYTPARSQASVSSVTMKDYYTLKNIDAFKALFVLGSDIYGPMGKELVPLEKPFDAQTFLKDHKGKKVLGFREITPAILKSLE